jgi:hypothetical protein
VSSYKSLFAWLNSNVALWPPERAIDMLLTDVEALGMIAKPGLISYSPLCSASQCLGRKDTDALHVLVSIIELVNVLEEKNGAHGAAA